VTDPRAIVIPFGVPSDGRGLGLGLAALVHAFVQVDGSCVAIAQLHARPEDRKGNPPAAPVEAFVPPAAWKELAGRGDSPAGAGVVITGAFEPPLAGPGAIQLLAFDARDGHTCARVDATVDEEHAGANLIGAIEQLGSRLGGEIGGLQGLRDLGWEPLESVLRAERCALHDPVRGGPHDRLAAMLHLGRAIGDAPDARYPADRLAAIALDTAYGPASDANLSSAAVRALERASEDAPAHVGLLEALAALLLRLGRPRDAERTMSAVIAKAPGGARPYTLLAQALRVQGKLDGALAALQTCPAEFRRDPLISVERGMVLTARGDLEGAAASWREVVSADPVQPVAFCGLAALALRLRDGVLAQSLVDAALASSRAHPDVLRRAVQLAVATEENGLPRASRVARLCGRLLEQLPDDPSAHLALAQSLVVLGERSEARSRLARLETIAPLSAAAAEGQLVKLALDQPSAEVELQSVMRAAQTASARDLAEVSMRARRLATIHGAWSGWLAAAVADRRRQRWTSARVALDRALEIAPGATPAHLEAVGILLAIHDVSGALTHAERAVQLEGESPQTLRVLAGALAASGRRSEAIAAANRALSMKPDDDDLRSLATGLGQGEAQRGWGAKLMTALAGWRKT
jgi:tetratricopeptide (TPR) repeat protein